MACMLQPECNVLHGYFRCHLPNQTVDIEVRMTSMQGHMYSKETEHPN